LRFEVAACAVSSSAADPRPKFRPVAIPERLRRSPFDPPLRGGPFVDVLLEGSAVPRVHQAATTTVSLAVGDWSWSAAVFGVRRAVGVAGHIAIGDPMPIDRPVPIAFETAFGGEAPSSADVALALDREIDSARVYPRNPFGLGYRHGRVESGWYLPQIEDPADLLTDQRLERIADEGWEAGPLPWCLDEVHAATFPRAAWIGMGPDVVAPESLAEVRRGWLAERTPDKHSGRIEPCFLQDASPWAWLAELRAGTLVEATGCLPRGATFAIELPQWPRVIVTMGGRDQEVGIRPARITVRPDMRDVIVTWVGEIEIPPGTDVDPSGRSPIAVRMADESTSSR